MHLYVTAGTIVMFSIMFSVIGLIVLFGWLGDRW